MDRSQVMSGVEDPMSISLEAVLSDLREPWTKNNTNKLTMGSQSRNKSQ